jgi:hypothetical protein
VLWIGQASAHWVVRADLIAGCALVAEEREQAGTYNHIIVTGIGNDLSLRLDQRMAVPRARMACIPCCNRGGLSRRVPPKTIESRVQRWCKCDNGHTLRSAVVAPRALFEGHEAK